MNTVTEAGEVGLYVSNSDSANSFIRAYYPPPDRDGFDQPPLRPPTIGEQYAVSADTESGLVRAKVNPHFWELPFEGPATTVEYGSAPCSEGGCAAKPAAPGSALGAGILDRPVERPPKSCSTASSPPRPTTTASSPKAAAAARSSAPTRPSPPSRSPVHRKPARTTPFARGAAARLPDCRGYEMVSPLDKAGGDIEALEGLPLFGLGADFFNMYFRSQLNQASPEGEAITYSAARAFAGAVSSPWTSQYLASRTPQGWQTESLNHPLGESNLAGQRNQETPFRLLQRGTSAACGCSKTATWS